MHWYAIKISRHRNFYAHVIEAYVTICHMPSQHKLLLMKSYSIYVAILYDSNIQNTNLYVNQQC